jgi:hypothetical protein
VRLGRGEVFTRLPILFPELSIVQLVDVVDLEPIDIPSLLVLIAFDVSRHLSHCSPPAESFDFGLGGSGQAYVVEMLCKTIIESRDGSQKHVRLPRFQYSEPH